MENTSQANVGLSSDHVYYASIRYPSLMKAVTDTPRTIKVQSMIGLYLLRKKMAFIKLRLAGHTKATYGVLSTYAPGSSLAGCPHTYLIRKCGDNLKHLRRAQC